MSRIKFVVEEEEVTPNENQNDHSPKLPQQTSVANLELTSNVNEQDTGSGVDPLSTIKRPLSRVPLTLEEKKERQREYNRLQYLRKKANPVDPEIRAEKLRQKVEYQRKHRQQLLANATPEQREQIGVKRLEKYRRLMDKESEEQRQQRLERARQYYHKVVKQRMEQQWQTMTPEERGKIRLKQLEAKRRQLENESEEHRKQRLERVKQYYHKVGKQRKEQQRRQTMTPEEREKEKRTNNTSLEKEMQFEQQTSGFNLVVVDNSGKSSTNSTKKKRKPGKKQCFELSMSIFDSDSSNFDDNNRDIDGETTNTLIESPKPGPSKKLPDHRSAAEEGGTTRLSEYNSMLMKVNQEQQPEEEEVLAVNLETEIEVAVKSKRCTRSVKIPNEMVVERKQQPKKPRLAKLTPDQREHRKIVERNRLLKELSTPETRQAILERWRREREKPLFWPYNLVNRKRSVKETAALDLNRTTILEKNESETTTD